MGLWNHINAVATQYVTANTTWYGWRNTVVIRCLVGTRLLGCEQRQCDRWGLGGVYQEPETAWTRWRVYGNL